MLSQNQRESTLWTLTKIDLLIFATHLNNCVFRYHFTIKMSFACQRDCYAKTYKTKVISCEPVQLEGKSKYEVILEDTVLFPEGGGQASDLVRYYKETCLDT